MADETNTDETNTANAPDSSAAASTDDTTATESAVTPASTGGEVLSADAALAVQQEAENRLARSGFIGAVIGAVLGALVWMGLVALSLLIADTGIDTVPMLAMGAGVGVFAGVFYGGWAGTLYGNTAIERAEAASEAEEHAHR